MLRRIFIPAREDDDGSQMLKYTPVCEEDVSEVKINRKINTRDSQRYLQDSPLGNDEYTRFFAFWWSAGK